MEIDKDHASIMLKRLLENGICRDQIELIADDKLSFSVPRLILTAASNYFAASLGSNFREGSNSEFLMEGTDGKTLKEIVDFLYTGQITLTEGNVEKFFAIASGVSFDMLEEKCCQFYAEKLSVTNSVATWMIADKFNNANLCETALTTICEAFEKVPAMDIHELQYRFILEILKSDKIQATEKFVFDRLLNWMEYKESDRQQHMPELLKLVRLAYIPTQFLDDKIVTAYKRFDCFGQLIAEYQRRASNKDSVIGSRRGRSMYCFFVQYAENEGAKYSAIKVEKYNSILNSFDEIGEILLGDRKLFGVVFHKHKLYVLGGFVNNTVAKNMMAYDLNTLEEEILPDMKNGRQCFASTVFGKYIYVFGGYDGHVGLDVCERFDTETKTWKRLKAMNVARQYAAATVVNDYIYVAGGKTDQTTPSNVVELYDPASDEWVQVASMNMTRSAFTLVNSNGILYTFGQIAIIEKFNPWKYIWTKIGSFTGSAFITSAIEINREIFVIIRDGRFGQIKFDESGCCSFVDLCKSKYASHFLRQHYLYQN